MESEGNLPRFRRPPLVEVVHGVQFERLPMTIVHPGLFYSRLVGEFPQSQTVPPIAPLHPFYEQGPQPVAFRLPAPDDVPRAWFIGSDGSTLMQLQADRLLFNWRKEPSQSTYPHFDQVHARFVELYQKFEQFALQASMGDIKPQICEMTYINQFPLDGRSSADVAKEIFRGWKEDFGQGWSQPADAFNWSARYTLRRTDGEAFGRLTANLANVLKLPDNSPILQFDITVHGSPSAPGLTGVSHFHKTAHELIVSYFVANTTDVAHEKWDRIREQSQ